MIKDPFFNVVPWLRKLTSVLTPKSRSLVSVSCRTSPLTRVRNLRPLASPSLTVDTIDGPRGAKWSNPLEKHHWGTPPAYAGSLCHLRAERSFPTV